MKYKHKAKKNHDVIQMKVTKNMKLYINQTNANSPRHRETIRKNESQSLVLIIKLHYCAK
jgi:hypothetical protein